MAAKFELKKSEKGQFFFNLKAGNGEVVFTSQMYKSRESAEKGIASVQANAGAEARYERKTSTKGEPYFVLKAANGEVLGRSEMYSAPASMEKGIQSVMKNGPAAKVVDLSQDE